MTEDQEMLDLDRLKAEFAERHPWIDPTLGYPDSTLRNGVEEFKGGYVAIRHGGAHKAVPWLIACHDENLDHIDGEDWELFTLHLRGTIEGQQYYWGMFVLGLGFANVMVPAEYVRSFTPEECKRLSRKRIVMAGMMSGEASYSWRLPDFSSST